jgi:hypothetical protein
MRQQLEPDKSKPEDGDSRPCFSENGLPTSPHGVKIQKINIFTAVRSSNLTEGLNPVYILKPYFYKVHKHSEKPDFIRNK